MVKGTLGPFHRLTPFLHLVNTTEHRRQDCPNLGLQELHHQANHFRQSQAPIPHRGRNIRQAENNRRNRKRNWL
ncbi:hypothetical protein I7I53_08723 [Histoplasma capsulatum var. duboisii H88]|uniref:Uncharacterized protein n=1 Tax=Ajellomyces capsulatus (strain H88) TaxID=544711 RepID=A0A8A1L7N9_AJEC8|nr:hypothetical protein I7I53_08723 [Histoplasma capsulatum var. duboisii H88]